MTTLIKFSAAHSLEDPRSPISVTETVDEVVFEVNSALNGNLAFVQLTDAGSNKQITVDPKRVDDISEE